MSGEILADGNSAMIMTVDQYNERVAYTWKLAAEAEQERIIKLIKSQITPCLCEQDCMADDNPAYQELIELIKGETNG